MNTERHIIYSIINTVRNAEHNNDEPVSERLMRSFLHTYRPDCIRKYYKDGHTVNDEVFQRISIKMNRVGTTNEFTADLPKVIRLNHHYGLYLEKNGISIPIVESEQYMLSKRNPFGKHLVQAKTEQQKLSLFGGELTNCISGENENGLLIVSIIDELENQQQSNQQKVITVDFFGILMNPDDQPGYDWENDVYPFPAEKEEELKSQILRKEFGIMIQAKKDEVSNSRADDVTPKTEQNIDG